MKTLIYFTVIFQFVTAIIALIKYNKFKNSYLKYFIILTIYVGLNDFLIMIYTMNFNVQSNLILYHIKNAINFGVLFYIYKKAFDKQWITKLANVFLIVYGLLIIVELFLLKVDYFSKTQVLPYIFGGTCVIFLSLYYFYNLLKSNKIIQFDRDLLFWISTGLFIYYIAYIPFKVSQNYFASSKTISSVFYIRPVVTILVNCIFIIGFLWSKTEKQVSS